MGPIFLSGGVEADLDQSDRESLAERLSAELGLLPGHRATRVMLDVRLLAPGAELPAALDVAAHLGGLMVLLVSPATFLSASSREEILLWERLCRRRGRGGSFVPVLWRRSAHMEQADDDEVGVLLRSKLAVDLSELRYESWNHPGKARALHNLATRIAAQQGGQEQAQPPPRTDGQAAADLPLVELLARMFTAVELRHLAAGLPGAASLSAALPPGPVPARAVATALVAGLRRLGRVDEAFFQHLQGERPWRAEEIAALSRSLLQK